MADALESIAASLAAIANPRPVDTATEIRKGMDALRKEMPVIAMIFDQINARAIEAQGQQESVDAS